MSSHLVLILVRVLHIVAGTLWVGGAVLVAGFIAPAIRAVGPAGAPVMRHLTKVQKLPYVLLLVGLLALLSGVYLTWVVSSGSLIGWVKSYAGATYMIGAIAAFSAAIIGIGVNIPIANRLARLAVMPTDTAALPPPTGNSAGVLTRRLVLGTRAVAVLLLVALSAMAAARYVS